jgi:hypothetical protein
MKRSDLWGVYGARNLSAGGISRRQMALPTKAAKGRYAWQKECFSS